MKKIILALFLLIFSFSSISQSHSPALRQDQILDSLAKDQGIKEFMFYTLIATRCATYMPENEQSPCASAVARMMGVLDSDIIFPSSNVPAAKYVGPGEFLFIAFKKNLTTLLSSPTTTEFLNDVQQKLYRYLLGQEQDFNLWELALQHYKTMPAAAKVIAALFQDTSPAKLHLAYLDKTQTNGGANFLINKELLNRTIDTINTVVDYTPASFNQLFYPHEISKDLNRNLYHFYVPLYLSMALNESGVKKQMAFAASLFMTLTYEFITSADDYRYLFTDPKTIDSEWKIRDIFGGLQGSAMGVNKKVVNEFRFYKEHFAESTAVTVKKMLLKSSLEMRQK